MELPSSSSASLSMTMDSYSTSSVAILGKKGKAAGTGRTVARKAAEKEAAALNRKQHQSAGFEAERGFTNNQRLRLAGIAQSRALLSGMMSNRERQRAKGQIIKEAIPHC
jgi:phage-related tail fiber protein